MDSMNVSPTPLPHGYRDLAHRPSRSILPRTQLIRPNLKRGSPLHNGYGSEQERHNSLGDSSDDEAPIPQLSAAAEELLGVKTGERPAMERSFESTSRARYNAGSPVARDAYPAPRILSRTQQASSPPRSEAPSPRVVKINSERPMSGSLRRAVSIAGTQNGSPLGMRGYTDMKTPATRPRSHMSGASKSPQDLENYSGKARSGGSEAIGLTTTAHRNRSEDPAVQGSIRIKRLGKMSGSFLSGPARRGVIRRQSEEDQVPYSSTVHRASEDERDDWIPQSRRESPQHPASPLGYESRQTAKVHFVKTATPYKESDDQPSLPADLLQPSISSHGRPQADAADKPSLVNSIKKLNSPALLPIQSSRPSPELDQENLPPPTSRRDKPNHEIIEVQDKPRLVDAVSKVQVGTTPARKPLAAKTNNTPLRPAPPPPPKMSVLETATAPAASSANAKKKPRNMISVNGKHFTRLECVGRGGSGRVYRVMAENFKLFAVKSVSLENLDEVTIRGFKGEIELLRKLQDVDRVVRLYDYEINEEKKVLRVLMDIGELDLKKILDPKMDEETGKLDITFTRYIWKEMLDCVSAVHDFDIVHSDLKPANFVMIQGRLKLIDFGIANAIQDDTVNVHREQQVGTPNYMSPETLIDTNVQNGQRQSGTGKLIKVGKPSDVWSLGCILYQIVYGKLPFAHITNYVRKVMAICDPSHVISYPATGVGGVPVPVGLLRTLRKCLDRDPSRRPTVEQLLSMGDMFLHPDAPGTVPVSVELIGRLQHNIIQHITTHGVPSDEELKIWPKRFFESIRAAVEEGRA